MGEEDRGKESNLLAIGDKCRLLELELQWKLGRMLNNEDVYTPQADDDKKSAA